MNASTHPKKKTLLINPDFFNLVYADSKIKAGIEPGNTTLAIACIAAPLLRKNYPVKFIDLNITEDPHKLLVETLLSFKPDIVGITACSASIDKSYQIVSQIKEISPRTLIVLGGPHPSAFPVEVLTKGRVDCVVQGVGDFTLLQIAEEGLHDEIPNIIFKEEDKVIFSKKLNTSIEDLDALPFPAYEIFDIPRYYQTAVVAKKSPVGHMETSRGCYAKCVFCNKNIHGFTLRTKSSKRVVDEMEHMLKLGFREIHFFDDLFTADMDRAYKTCEEIIRRNLKISWFPRGGIRVDRVSEPLLKIMKQSGCYRIPFGVESGSQRVLDKIQKNIKVEQVVEAVRLAKKVGLETECYFMLGLPTETVDDMKKTIELAIQLNPDYCKFAKSIPLPGTPMFEQMKKENRIKTFDWKNYTYSTPSKNLYIHDTLTSEEIDRYYDLAHFKFYFRLRYILPMIIKTLREGTFWTHVKYVFKTQW